MDSLNPVPPTETTRRECGGRRGATGTRDASVEGIQRGPNTISAPRRRPGGPALHGHHAIAISEFGPEGNVLTPEEMVTRRKKLGVCVLCGVTRTHSRPKRMIYLSLKPVTDNQAYKGHCLRCNGGLAKVKQSLGEELTVQEAASLARVMSRRTQLTTPPPSTTTSPMSTGAKAAGSDTTASTGLGRNHQNATTSNTRLDSQAPSHTEEEENDADSTLGLPERAQPRFHFVDTGALHLTRAQSRFIDSLDLDIGENHHAALVQEAARDGRDTTNLLKLNRTASCDGLISLSANDAKSSADSDPQLSPSRGGESIKGGVDFGALRPSPVPGVLEGEPQSEREQEIGNEDVNRLRSMLDTSAGNDLGGIISFISSHKSNSAVIKFACEEIRTRAPRGAQLSRTMKAPQHNPNEVVPPSLQRQKTLEVTNILPPHWVKVLISTMERNMGDGSVLADIIQTIWVVSSLHPRFKTDICDCGGVIAVANSMRCHPNNTKLQLYGAGLFTTLLANDRHASYLKRAGSVFERMMRLAEYSNPEVSAYALRALFLMHTSNDDAFLSKFRKDTSTVDVIVHALNLHVSSPSVQERGIDLLWQMSMECGSHENLTPNADNDSSNDNNDSASLVMMSNDVAAAISTAVSKHKSNRMIQQAALGLMCNVSSTISLPVTRPMTENLAKSIATAMTHCPVTCTASQGHGCRVVANTLRCASINLPSDGGSDNCITVNELKAIFAGCGIIDALLRAMAKPWLDNTLLGNACDALTALCTDAPQLKAKLIEAGGVAIAADIIRAYDGFPADQAKIVRDSASRTLVTLSNCPEGMAALDSFDPQDQISSTILGASGTGASPTSLLWLNMRCEDEDPSARVDAASSVVSGVLQKYSSAAEATQALSLLLRISESEDCIDILLSSVGAFDRVLCAMERYPDLAALQQAGCALLSNVYISNSGSDGHPREQDSLGSELEVQIILKVIRLHKFRSDVQEYAMLCLRNLTVCFSSRISANSNETSALQDAIGDIIDAMETNRHSIRVQENASGLLWALAELTSSLQLTLESSCGVQHVVRVFLELGFDEEEGVLSEALGCLAAFSSCPDIVSALASRTGISILLSCLETFKEHQDHVERACALLSAISFYSHAARMEMIQSHDTVVLVISCMRLHSSSAFIQKESFALLANIAIDDCIQRIFSEGGLVQVESGISNYLGDSAVQREACELLCSLVHVIPSDVHIVSSIIQVASAHDEDERIQLKCIEALWACAAKGHSYKREIALFGGVDIIVEAMRRHISSTALLEKGCVCLWSLAFDSETSVLIGQSSHAITDAMIAHVDDSQQLQLEALGALKTLAATVENKRTLQNDSTIRAIVIVMWAHNSSDRVQEAALMALTNIAVNPRTNGVMAIRHNELEVIVSAMRRFPESLGVQEQACILLRNYTFTTSNVALMKSNPLVFQALADALDRFPAKCGERASFVIDCLYGD